MATSTSRQPESPDLSALTRAVEDHVRTEHPGLPRHSPEFGAKVVEGVSTLLVRSLQTLAAAKGAPCQMPEGVGLSIGEAARGKHSAAGRIPLDQV